MEQRAAQTTGVWEKSRDDAGRTYPDVIAHLEEDVFVVKGNARVRVC